MSEKELPPLRVRLLGDDSDFRRMVDRARQGADNLSRSIADGAAQQRTSAIQDAKDRWKGLQMFLKYEEQKRKDRWRGHLQFLRYEEEKRREIEKTANAHRRAYIRQVKFNSQVMEDQRRAQERAEARQLRSHRRNYIRQVKFNSQIMEDQRKAEERQEKDRRRAWKRRVQFNSKMLEDQQKAEERQEQRRRRAWRRQIKFNSQVMEDQRKEEERQEKARRRAWKRQVQFNSKILEDQQKADERQEKARKRAWKRQVKFNSQVMEDQRKAEEKRVKDIEKWLEKSAKDVRKYEEKKAAEEKKAVEKATKLREKEEQKRLQQIKKAAEAAHRFRLGLAKKFEVFRTSMRDRTSARADMGFGLGARADIYMHVNALKNIVQTGKGFLDVAISFEQSQVAIAAFTGDLAEADKVMARIQDYAIASPYQTVQLAEMARNMMSYGIAADDAVGTLQMLGDVAGGSGLRLERLSFAMSQISSMGRLQGQELRQLTEQGFNPLETISRKTGYSMMTLKKAMEDGKISAEMVTEALKVETSAGGRFAAMAQKMQNSLGGMINQAKELIQKMSLTMVKALEGDMKKALLYTIERLKKLIAFLETPAGKEAIKRFAEIAKHVLVMAIAFHTVGLAIAVMRWQVASLATILSVLQMALLPVRMLLSALAIPLMLAAHAIQVFLSGSILGFAGFIVSLAGTLAGLGLAGVAVAAVRDLVSGNNGLGKAFEDLPNKVKQASNAIQGFFYNIHTNWKILLDWFKVNYKSIMEFVMDSSNRILRAIGNNILVIGKFLAEAFDIGIRWLETYLPPAIERIMAAVGRSIYKASTSWMSAAWKKQKETFTGTEFLMGGASMQSALEMFAPFLPGYDAKKVEAAKAAERAAKAEEAKKKGQEINFAGELSKPLDDLIKGLQHGFEKGFDLKGLKLPEFKLDRPEIRFPELPELKMPEEFTPDFSALGNLAQSLQGIKLTDTAAYRSADHAKQVYEYTRNMEAIQAGLKGDTKKEDVQKQQLKALQGIEKNTRPGAAPQAANLATP